MDLAQMGAYLTELHTSDLFRLETLAAYRAASDGDAVEEYLRGGTEPTTETPWLAKLRADTRAGRCWRKVHVVRGELTDYERYEFDWGFRHTVGAGENVRILEVTEESRLDELVGDFFVVDGHVVLTHYDEDGRHVGAEVVDGREALALIALRDLMWEKATDFTEWWAAHPQYHRATQAA